MHSVNSRWNRPDRPLSFVSVNSHWKRVTTLDADSFGHLRCRNEKRGPKTEVNCMKIVFIPTSSLSFITRYIALYLIDPLIDSLRIGTIV